MVKPRTHFEQVPLEIVKKIAEEEMLPETVTGQIPVTRKKNGVNGDRAAPKQSKASARKPSKMELPKP
jgi:hypothetical protein